MWVPGRSRLFSLLSLFTLWGLCFSSQMEVDNRVGEHEETVIDLLETLNSLSSTRGITSARGHNLEMPAWRLGWRTPHLILPPESFFHFIRTWHGSLGLYLYGKQAKDSKATLLSLSSPKTKPLFQLISNTQDDFLQLEFCPKHDMKPEVLKIPGGNPFSGSKWTRIALSMVPGLILLYQECQQVTVLELKGQSLTLSLPHNLQVTFSSTAEFKASKFNGHWRIAELSTGVYEKRPWLCDNKTDPDLLPVASATQRAVWTSFPQKPVDSDLVVHDQPERVAGTVLSPSGSSHDGEAPRDPRQHLSNFEEALQSVTSMLNMLKAQNQDLQARVKYLESCECVRKTCTSEGRVMEEGSRWMINSCTVCSCISGKVQCATSNECNYEDRIYCNNEVFSPHPCSTCVCENGKVGCQNIRCPSLSCLKTFVPQGLCCPVCHQECEYEGGVYTNGEVFVPRSNPCLNCQCSESLIRCNPKQCSPFLCANPYKRPGECCPTCSACDLDGRPYNGSFSTIDGCQTCTCRNGNLSCVDAQNCPVSCLHGVKPPFGSCCRDCSRCDYEGKIVLEGVSFLDHGDPCKQCVCNGGNVVCTSVSCPKLSCTLLETVGGECCARCRSCVHHGVYHHHGSEWQHPEDPCLVCTCLEGHVKCKTKECKHPCRNPVHVPGTCCPVCDGCGIDGHNVLNGEEVPREDRCERCVCMAGEVVCEKSVSTCPPLHCTHPAKLPGQCCLTCDMCEYKKRTYSDGNKFNPPGEGPCLKCVCEGGSIRCHQEKCPPVQCTNPIREPHMCCPFCKSCVVDHIEYEHGSVWDSEDDSCKSCSCTEGNTMCWVKDCPPITCLHANIEPGECCASCHRCLFNQRIYENGQIFFDPDKPCQKCICQTGSVQCDVMHCPPVSCPNPHTPSGQCCPQCPDCDFNNHIFFEGETFPSPVNPCEECVCTSGHVDCHHQCPRPSCHNPLPGTCCPNNCNGCSYAGKEYPNGIDFPHPTDKCRECHCINGNVQCLTKRCPTINCDKPLMIPGECCPQCPAPPADCIYQEHSYRHKQHFYHPTDSCQSCLCMNGTVNCRRRPCPSASCAHPIPQDCCRTCDGCLYNSIEHANGAVFSDVLDPCGMCVCREGTVTCERTRCPHITCPFPVQGKCCEICDGCKYDGMDYLTGQEFPDPVNHCNHCVCMNGHVTCNRKPCYNPGCSHPALMPGHCCPVCDGCSYNGVTLLDGEKLPNVTDTCSECICRAGSVQCVRRVCAAALCPHPVIGPCGCLRCEDCVFQGEVYADGKVFSAPKAVCEECKCTKGNVSCTPKSCLKVTCPHPAADLCGCAVCDGCIFHGKECVNGEYFPDPQNHCQQCTCLNGGVSCKTVACPPVSCRKPAKPAGLCCPVCTGMCEHIGQEYESGSTFTSATDQCLSCTCLNEIVSCQRKPCAQQCTHPVWFTDCCPVCDMCLYEGVQYTHTQSFINLYDSCQHCVCVSGSVTCKRITCPVITCPNPVTPSGQCCKQCRVCVQHGLEYKDGQRWKSSNDPCFQCTCQGGLVKCVGPQCEELSCMQQVTDPESCCPRCRGCVYDGVEHIEGSSWFASSSPCMSCMCVDGVTTCSDIQCLSVCVNQISVSGECCPLCADCIYDGHLYGPGETFHPSDDPCQICTCEVMPDGQQHLRCFRKQCPSLVDCPKYNILFRGPDSCCPVCAQPFSNCTAENEVLVTDDPCFTCQCKDLTWTCIHRACLPLSCPPNEQYTPPDYCCPVCDVCVVEGERERIPNGKSWTDSEDECITCSCNLGHIECNIEECVPLICQDGMVKVKSPGKCCYECQEVNVQCDYDGQVFNSNEHWDVDECTACTCMSGDVHCQAERCPTISCASDETPSLIPGMCCPHCIPRPATCLVFGDPHYRTFDGKMVNFQGSCTYVLAQDCEGGDFSIHVTNDDRGRKGVSWTKDVTVYIGNVVIQLLQDWVVKVDYQTISLPFLMEPFVYLERKSNTILLNSKIGVKVLWNGHSHLEVSVPGTYKKHMCGLCGNFNNYPQDDMRLRNGQISTSEATFGNDWKVGSGNQSSGQCSDARNIDPCKEAGYFVHKSANNRCAVLKSMVFERCHKVVPPEMFFASCVYDLCACASNMDECVCDTLEAYASECREAGVVLHWRSPSLCAVGCPVDRGYVFDECGPPCPKTCFNKDVPLGVIEAHCFKPCVPGCQCPAGMVEHDSHCIFPEKCPKVIYETNS